jgi:arylsulfatase A-like enzyme
MDLLPTLAGITGAKLPGWTLDGRNILSILEGRPASLEIGRRAYRAGEPRNLARSPADSRASSAARR